MSGWQPIADAVKDERRVDLWIVGPRSPQGYRETDCWWFGYRAYAGHGGQQNTVIRYGWVRDYGRDGVCPVGLYEGDEPTHFRTEPLSPGAEADQTDWVSEIAQSDPIYGSEMDGSPCCVFCSADSPSRDGPKSHDPDCLWRRAKEAQK